ncbi:hypothetical protein GCM10010289_06490 [Streptomyces violascens]|uniref:CsbD-like domain-containing protein n=2 Tax=Streptomyces violascens TaxID=67381 RepID=A0ABQ3QGA2_9ACTN|nr:hypothetical protein GCM10010289_06490 [Streptomyces violascens]GHI36314.1 hypothetical protein Sviol_07220 [Streptomyces violascens]
MRLVTVHGTVNAFDPHPHTQERISMGKAEKLQDKARQAAEQAKVKASEAGQQISDRSSRQRTEDEQERAEQAMRDAGIDRG